MKKYRTQDFYGSKVGAVAHKIAVTTEDTIEKIWLGAAGLAKDAMDVVMPHTTKRARLKAEISAIAKADPDKYTKSEIRAARKSLNDYSLRAVFPLSKSTDILCDAYRSLDKKRKFTGSTTDLEHAI